MKYYIETYGCQMNFAESASLENSFNEEGFIKTLDQHDADIIVLNTCSVRKSAEERVWGRLGELKTNKKEKDLILVLTGCMADHFGLKAKEKCKELDFIISNCDKSAIPKILKNFNVYKFESSLENAKNFKWSNDHYVEGSFKSFVPIMQGCSNFCTYCIVPYVRGPEVSRSLYQILDEIKVLVEKGVVEITLLGQNVNSYNFEGKNFCDLLEEICTKTKIKWLRFVSSHPKDVSDRLIDIMAKYPQICPSLLLPVQHGSDEILKKMNRKYSSQDYLTLVSKFKAKIPDIALSTDILIGFPTETEEDFEATISLMEKVKFEEAFTYYYNLREGTAAAKMDGQLSEELKKERLEKIIAKQLEISAIQRERHLNKELDVLVETISKKDKSMLFGRTIHNNMAVFKGDKNLIGKIVKVKINEIKGNTLVGSLVDEKDFSNN